MKKIALFAIARFYYRRRFCLVNAAAKDLR